MRECDITHPVLPGAFDPGREVSDDAAGRGDESYGERLRRALKELFEVIHRREELSAVVFERQLKAARDAVLQAGMTDVPTTRHAENMAKRFRKHGEAYFTFVTTPGVEPTNNRRSKRFASW